MGYCDSSGATEAARVREASAPVRSCSHEELTTTDPPPAAARPPTTWPRPSGCTILGSVSETVRPRVGETRCDLRTLRYYFWTLSANSLDLLQLSGDLLKKNEWKNDDDGGQGEEEVSCVRMSLQRDLLLQWGVHVLLSAREKALSDGLRG